MSNNKADISHIRKYLEEGLDARAMHQLEREAQDDPFLMEAMEGFELSGNNPQTALDDLDARLQLRTGTAKTRRLTPWWAISAAASVILVLTVAYLFWPSGKKVAAPTAENLSVITTDHPQPKVDTVPAVTEKKLIAANTAPATQRYVPLTVKADEQIQAPPVSAEVRPDEPLANAETKQVAADKNVSMAAAAVPVIDSNYMRVNRTSSFAKTARTSQNFDGYTQWKDTTVSARKAAANNLRYDSTKLKEVVIGYAAKKQAMAVGSSTLNTALQGKVDGVDVTTPDRIHGTISDIAGLPLPGVSILIPGTKTGTQTDAMGHFTITAADGQTLDIRYIGYASKQVKVKANDENNIALQPNNASLNEVVVVPVKKVKPDNHAHPREGWDNFNTYLKNVAITEPDEQEGTVQLSFTVDAQGELKDIKVVKGLTSRMNQRAISLLQERSPWVAEADGTTKTIKLKIRFSKKP